jgi:hypothetical protein
MVASAKASREMPPTCVGGEAHVECIDASPGALVSAVEGAVLFPRRRKLLGRLRPH